MADGLERVELTDDVRRPVVLRTQAGEFAVVSCAVAAHAGLDFAVALVVVGIFAAPVQTRLPALDERVHVGGCPLSRLLGAGNQQHTVEDSPGATVRRRALALGPRSLTSSKRRSRWRQQGEHAVDVDRAPASRRHP